MPGTLAEDLKNWFVQEKREFPWRENPTPYAVWISEIMLQQTRASVVEGYFLRWMKLFPTVAAVAQAPIELLMKAWEGLGYYSRVRNIQKAAKMLEGSEFPSSLEDLLKIPGVGPYTAGAIASFAFHQKAAAVDGNVARVISRYFGLEGEVKNSLLEEKTLLFLEEVNEPWVVMEALIELGATYCQKNPRCQECPLQKGCLAHLQGKTDAIPFKKKRPKTIYVHRQVAIIICEEEVLIEKKQEGQVLGGLVEFPSFADVKEQEGFFASFSPSLSWIADLPEEKQSFTRYQVDLSPSVFCAFEKKQVQGLYWVSKNQLTSLTFSSGHKRILLEFLKDSR